MYIEGRDMQVEIIEKLRSGSGSTQLLHIVPKESLPSKVRLFSVISLEKGCGIGKHQHNGETEMYYILSGEGALDDNGRLRTVRKGDSNVCRDGEYHSISNEKDETLKILAVIALN